MFFATQLDNQKMRIHTWDEFSNSFTSQDITIDPWLPSNRGDMKCPSSNGYDICARADQRILNGWIRDNGDMGFLWNVAQGRGYPLPHLYMPTFK